MPDGFNEPRRHTIRRACYRAQNWPEYDRALQQRGRPRDYSAVAIETRHLLRLAFGLRSRHFRDYYLTLDKHGDQILAMSDLMAERARKPSSLKLHSIGEMAHAQRIADNDAPYVTPQDMFTELRDDPARRQHGRRRRADARLDAPFPY